MQLHLPQNLLLVMLLHLLLGLLQIVLLAELLDLPFVVPFVELPFVPVDTLLQNMQYKLFVTKFALHHFELPLV
jgi:hypothetical protein